MKRTRFTEEQIAFALLQAESASPPFRGQASGTATNLNYPIERNQCPLLEVCPLGTNGPAAALRC